MLGLVEGTEEIEGIVEEAVVGWMDGCTVGKKEGFVVGCNVGRRLG